MKNPLSFLFILGEQEGHSFAFKFEGNSIDGVSEHRHFSERYLQSDGEQTVKTDQEGGKLTVGLNLDELAVTFNLEGNPKLN